MASPENQHCANCIGTLSFPAIAEGKHTQITVRFYAAFWGAVNQVKCGALALMHASYDVFSGQLFP